MTKFAWFSVVCLQTLHLALCPTDPLTKPVKLGEDVILQCQDPRNDTIELVEWIRPDLHLQGYVFYFRDDRTSKIFQHPSFHGRVELTDSQMKNGDVSVILKKVTVNDTGTYECHVANGGRAQLISTITLTVTDSGDTKGDPGDRGNNNRTFYTFGVVILIFVLVIAAIIIFSWFKYKKDYKGYEKQKYDDTAAGNIDQQQP